MGYICSLHCHFNVRSFMHSLCHISLSHRHMSWPQHLVCAHIKPLTHTGLEVQRDNGLKLFLEKDDLERLYDFEEECVEGFFHEQEIILNQSTEERVKNTTERVETMAQKIEDINQKENLQTATVQVRYTCMTNIYTHTHSYIVVRSFCLCMIMTLSNVSLFDANPLDMGMNENQISLLILVTFALWPVICCQNGA